jgi:hypothetical protein
MVENLPTGNLPNVIISAVAHEGLSVTIDGKPARLAIVDDNGQVVACGTQVAREARAVAVNNYRNTLMATGHIRVLSKPINAEQYCGAAPPKAA